MAEIKRTIPNLPPNSRHIVRVRGYNQLGVASDFSEALSIVLPGDSSIPMPPTGLTFDFSSPDLLISWTRPTHNTDGTILNDFSRFRVSFTANNNLNVPTTKSYETTSPFFSYSYAQNQIDFGVARNTIQVEVTTLDVTGNQSAIVTGVAVNGVPSDPPDAPRLTAAFTLVTVSMSPNPADRDIARYQVEHSTTGVADSFFVVGETTGDTFAHTVAQGSTNYYRFRPIDVFGQISAGYSPVGSVATATAATSDDVTPPPAPTNLTATAGLDAATQRPYMDLSWTPSVPVDDDLNRYQLRWQKTGDTVRYTIIAPQASTYRLPDLDEDAEYTFTLYAYDHWGNESDPSNVATQTTGHDTIAPAIPAGIEVISGIRSIIIRWDPNVEFDFDAYELYASQTSGFTADTTTFTNRVFRGNATQYLHRAADNETWYFLLRAVDRNGNATAFTAEFPGSSLAGYTRSLDPTGVEEPFVKFGSGATSLTLSNLETRGLYMGSDDWNTAPFYVGYNGEVLARNIVITGELMDPGAFIIDTTNFKVTKEGVATAEELVANGGTIGGTTINSDRLTGGIIEGANFLVGSGGIQFTGSGSITWDAAATGGVVVSNQGYIQSANFDAGAGTGWQLAATGLTLGEGSITADSLQIGVSNTNLFVNSSFENGTTIATGWSASSAGATFDITETERLFQAKSQHVVCSSGGAGTVIGVRQDVIPTGGSVPADTPVAVSVWAKQTVGTSKQARIFVYDSTGTLISQSDPLTLTVNWQRIRWTFLTTKQETEFRCNILVDSPDTADEFYLDGAMLQLSSYVTDYNPAPLEIPDSYIQSAWISSLSADRIATGTIGPIGTGSVDIAVGPNGSIGGTNWLIDETGAVFQDGTISAVGAGGTVSFGPTSFSATYGANTGLLIDSTGVYIGGTSATSAGIYYDPATDKTLFQSDTGTYKFQIDTSASVNNRVLRLGSNLADPATDTFYLTADGSAFFYKGVIGLGTGSSMFNADDAGRVWMGAGPTGFDTAPLRIYADGSMILNLGSGTSQLYAGNTTDGVFFTSTGIKMYDGGTLSVDLPTTGTATFSGNISASVITGGTFQTGTSGERIVIQGGVLSNTFMFYTVAPPEFAPGNMTVGTYQDVSNSAWYGWLRMESPEMSSGNTTTTTTARDTSAFLLRGASNKAVGTTYYRRAGVSIIPSIPGDINASIDFEARDASSNTFIANGAAAIKLLTGAAAIQARNAADTAYGDIKCNIITYNGGSLGSDRDTKDEIQVVETSVLSDLKGTAVYRFKRKSDIPLPDGGRRPRPHLDDMGTPRTPPTPPTPPNPPRGPLVRSTTTDDRPEYIGWMADEVPEIARREIYDADGNFEQMGLDPTVMQGINWKATQELIAMVEQLRAEVEALKSAG